MLKTPNGYFTLDGQNSTADAVNITVPGLVAMGIDPATLKGALPTHGHGDHYNGLKHMQDTYGGPVYIGSADAVALTSANPRNAMAFSGSIVTTSIPTEVLTPQTITVDGLALTVLSTPGHTAGTVTHHSCSKTATTSPSAAMKAHGWPSAARPCPQWTAGLASTCSRRSLSTRTSACRLACARPR